MTPGWNWDFEDSQKAASPPPGADRPPTPAPGGQGQAPSPQRNVSYRRRRAGAGVVVLLALAAILIVLASSGHRASAPPLQASGRVSHVRVRPRKDTIQAGEAAVANVFAYTPFVKQGSERARDIALTFDDGPGPYTPALLSVLERLRVHATFFVIGEELRYFSASTVREIEDGDVIGDHTETHLALASLSAHDQHEELFEQILHIEALGGRRPTLFRPPYGSFNHTTIHELHALHLLMVLWSVDTGDYQKPGVPVIIERVLAGAHPGAIILMHDAGGDRTQTIAALPTIIHDLRARGYHLVTVPELLIDDPPPAGEPLPPSLAGD